MTTKGKEEIEKRKRFLLSAGGCFNQKEDKMECE